MIRKYNSIPGFPFLNEKNVLSKGVDSNGVVKSLHLRKLNTLELRKAVLGREAKEAFSKLKSLRVGNEKMWIYDSNNLYRNRLDRLYPGTVMPENVLQFLWFINYLGRASLLGKKMVDGILYRLCLMPIGLFELLLNSPGRPSRRKAATCGGEKLIGWNPPEYFSVLTRGYDGVSLGIMIDDGVHWTGLVENEVDGHIDRGTIFTEFVRQVDGLLNRIDGQPYIENYSYEQENGDTEIYTEEILLLVDKLICTYISDNNVNVSEGTRTTPYVCHYENYSIQLVKPDDPYLGWEFGAGLEMDLVSDWGFSEEIRESDLDMGILMNEPKKSLRKALPKELKTQFIKLIKLAEQDKPGPALVWGHLAWAQRFWWHGLKGYNECVRDTLIAAYRAMNRPFLVEVVKHTWNKRR